MFGKYETDKKYIFCGSVLNILLSIVFSKFFGLAGIMIGTCIGHFSFWIGRVVVLYKYYFEDGLLQYIRKQILFFAIGSLEILLFYFIFRYPSYSYLYLLEKSVCGFCLSLFIVFLGLLVTRSFKTCIFLLSIMKKYMFQIKD